MLTQLYNPKKGKMRIVGLISGSGKGLVAVMERQQKLSAMSKNNFEVVGIFTDNASSQASAIGSLFGIPVLTNDIRRYYHDRGKPINDLKMREAYDHETGGWFTIN